MTSDSDDKHIMSYPDKAETERMLRTKTLGRNIVCVDSVSSTNTLAKELAKEGAESGTLVMCREQTKGRGRNERKWLSDSENSLCMSFIYRPSVDAALIPRYSVAFALSAARAMRMFGADCRIKWPNDIISGGKKLCGLLSESGVCGSSCAFLVCGIGVNVNNHFNASDDTYIIKSPDENTKIENTAASLFDILGTRLQREHVAAEILNQAEPLFEMCASDEGFEEILKEYAAFSCIIGKRVTVYGEKRISGIAKGIDDLGRIIVTAEDRDLCFDSADVSLRTEELL